MSTFDFQDGNGPIPARRHANPDGTPGGWVADSASVAATAYVASTAMVYGNAHVMNDAKILNSAKILGNANVRDRATVANNAVVYGNATISDSAVVKGNAKVYGYTFITENSQVYGHATVYGSAIIRGDARIHGESSVFASGQVQGNAVIRGVARIAGNARVGGSVEIDGGDYTNGEWLIDASTPTPRPRAATLAELLNGNGNPVSSAEGNDIINAGSDNGMTTRQFGVEIELVGTTIPRVQDALEAAGITVYSQEYNHRTTSTWKIVPDGSLTSGGFEVVSPVLQGEAGIEQVRKVAAAIVAAGGSVDRSCGFHVHVNARDLAIDSIVQIAARYNRFEEEINRFMPASRRESRYCRPISELFYNHSIERILRGGTNYLGHLDRYHKVNLAAFARHGTVEFRQHSGTVNAEKMEKWVRFCLGFVESSVVVNREEVAPPIATRPSVPSATPTAPEGARRGRPTSDKLPRLYARFQGLGMGQSIRVADLAAEFEWTEATTTSMFTRLNAEYGCRIRTRFGRARMSYDPQMAARAAAERARLARALTLPVIENDSLFRGIPNNIAEFYTARALSFNANGEINRESPNMEESEAA